MAHSIMNQKKIMHLHILVLVLVAAHGSDPRCHILSGGSVSVGSEGGSECFIFKST